MPKTPLATYRVQLHQGFNLRRALGLVPYLKRLGISHLYVSPLLKACPGSLHGYDVTDHSQLNPELGTEEDLEALVTALQQHGLGLVVDIVPNHMGISVCENRWWWDVLQHGRQSRFADYFDIDWETPDPRLRGKVLVPVLGDFYGRLLERGELRLVFEQDQWLLAYAEHRFPLVPGSFEPRPGPPGRAAAAVNGNPARLDDLIQRQHYRLSDWHRGDAELNYRRFFNITTLAGIRVEDTRVFDAVHALIFRWYKKGWVDGIRVDHPDGLRDPTEYFQRLRAAAPEAWLVAEKILQPGEKIAEDWPVAGTTGYEFMRRATGLYVAGPNEKAVTRLYSEFTGEPTSYGELVREKQRQVLRDLLCAEVNWLTRMLVRVADRYWRYRDLAENEIREALIDVTARLPVYCTYVQAHLARVPEADAEVIASTIASARQRRKELPAEAFDLLENLLLLRLEGEQEHDFVMRFQQLTGPAMAKGAEDTACYCFNRFIALNMVGGDPGIFGMSPATFHARCQRSQIRWPDSMLTTSTHDTKRSEDVQMRLCLLSEMPEEWGRVVARCSRLAQPHRTGDWPDHNFEYFYYQTLVGAWPLPLERAWPAMQKAVREAKQHTSWSRNNADYEKAIQKFVAGTLTDRNFLAEVEALVAKLVTPGRINSLAVNLLKLTTPGVPDTYQGAELWDLSLMDPDNRRPVDFDLRQKLLAQVATLPAEEAWRRQDEGVPKLFMLQRTLRLRQAHPAWFGAASTYEPLAIEGPKAEHGLAFARAGRCVTLVPRLVLGLKDGWGATAVRLPAGAWRNVFTGEEFAVREAKNEAEKTLGSSAPTSSSRYGTQRVAELLKSFPVALLVAKEES